jgi:uncharacterized protein (TIGR03086 family)
MPADHTGIIVVHELAVHGWDLARATGQDFAVDPRTLQVLIGFLSQRPARGTPGFLSAVVDDEASLLERAVALSGRDPAWRPGSTSASEAAVA